MMIRREGQTAQRKGEKEGTRRTPEIEGEQNENTRKLKGGTQSHLITVFYTAEATELTKHH